MSDTPSNIQTTEQLAGELGLNVWTLASQYDPHHDDSFCPYCNAEYHQPDEVRPAVNCKACLGQAARAVKVELLVSGYFFQAEREGDLKLTDRLIDTLAPGYWRTEFRALKARLLQAKEGTP